MNTRKMRVALTSLAVAMSAFVAVSQDNAAEPAAVAKSDNAEQGKTAYKPLAEARAQIGDVISDPVKMTEIMKTLSPEDQKTFVADVNTAISKLPGSVEDKTAKYLNVNRAALKGASSGNMANVLAVTFATVPPESLTVISERYANDLFNRDADPSHKMTDATYEKTATEVVGKVVAATSGSDDAGVRNTLAIIMFVKADNGTIEELGNKLADTLPDSTTRELAKKEWIPAATAEGEAKSYDAMLAYADAGKAPNIDLVMSLAGPQILDAMVVDMTSSMDNSVGYQTTPVLDQAFGGFDEPRVNANELVADTKSAGNSINNSEAPRTANPLAPWNPEYSRGDIKVTPETVDDIIESEKAKQTEPGYSPTPTPEPEPEPQPYPWSSL